MSNPLSRHPPTNAALSAWLALNRVAGLAPSMALRLVSARGGPEEVLARPVTHLAGQALPPDLLRGLRAPDWSGVERDLAWRAQAGNGLICFGDASYPRLLTELSEPPLVLFCRGAPGLLSSRQLAVIGSRCATPAGRRQARELANGIAEAGMTVTSGLAVGIDAAAHEGALAATGKTVAVLGHGADACYPRGNRELLERVAERGVAVTEFPLGEPPRKHNFPRRNRIISGLSEGVLVVEARQRSGSMTTVRAAVEQGREVCAVPGSIENPLAEGPNRLLRDGARLVTGVTDLVDEFQLETAPAPARLGRRASDTVSDPATPEEARVLRALGHAPRSFDQLHAECALTPQALSSILLLLELKGLIVTRADGTFCVA